MQAKLILVSMSVVSSAVAMYFGREEAQVQVSGPAQAIAAPVAASPAATQINSAAPVHSHALNSSLNNNQQTKPVVSRSSLSLNNASGSLHTHRDDHEDEALPEDLQQDIEQRRIPASVLALKPVPGGYAMPAQGQHHTVLVAYIGDDGKLHRAERKVEPIPDIQIIVPAPTPAQRP